MSEDFMNFVINEKIRISCYVLEDLNHTNCLNPDPNLLALAFQADNKHYYHFCVKCKKIIAHCLSCPE